MKTVVVMVLALFLAVLAQADKVKKPKGVHLTRIPDQTVDLSPAPEIVAAQACANWARSAALEAMLASQGIELNQEFWALRIDGGRVCLDQWGDFERMAKDVNGEYVLDDGRRVTLTLSYAAGAPTVPAGLIQRLREGRTLMLPWRGRPYLLSGATYDEYIYPDGGRMFEIKELRLIDPLAKGDERLVRFSKTENAMGEIEGVLEVVSSTSQSQSWIRERQHTREEQPWTPKRQEPEPNRPWTPDSRPWNPKMDDHSKAPDPK